MFFVASKIYWYFASPITFLILLGLLGALFARSRFGRAAQAASAIALLILLAAAVTPLGYLLIWPLEARFPQAPPDTPAPYGVIILGGAMAGPMTLARNQPTFEEGERVVEAAHLAQLYPQARIVFSGGNGAIISGPSSEAEAARMLLVQLGVDPRRIILENRSRNTEENARFSAALLHPEPSQRWLLVTSAYHMPRSMGLFEKAGFNVVAYPVGFRTYPWPMEPVPWEMFPTRNLKAFELALREWMGLVAYRLTGRIDEWFPGPKGNDA